MYKKDKIKLYKKLSNLITSGKLSKENYIYIFGINDPAREIIAYLRDNGIIVRAILDNNPQRQHIYCSGIRSIALDEMTNAKEGNNRFLVYSAFWREMVRDLSNLGVEHDNIFLLLNLNPIRETFLYRMYYVWRGRKIYRNILNKYPDGEFFLLPYTGTGDVYLVGTLFNAYQKKWHIRNPVFIVVSEACRKVAKIFGWENVIKLSDTEDCSRLISYYMTCPQECNINVLNDSWGEIYTNNIEWLRGYKNLNFTMMFSNFVFALNDSCRPEKPIVDEANVEINNIFEEQSLRRGETIVLSPYSNTLADLPEDFWEKIAKSLNEKGYIVCTNCGAKTEKPIKGTKKLFFPLDIAPQVISAAGGFIGIRSGFCDVISAANAKKVILYDRYNYFYNCSSIDYFSLKKIGLCDDAVEMEFDTICLEKTISAVLDVFGG